MEDLLIKENEICFAGNDYLGFAKRKLSEEALKEDVGSSGSRLTTGTHLVHLELEEYIAKWQKTEAALVFNSGYSTNLGVLKALLSKEDVVYSDSSNHSSIIDGINLSKCHKEIYEHSDLQDLEKLLSNSRDKHKKALIITNTVFSINGDKAKLEEISALAKKYKASVYVDEAHGTGVIGSTGAGLASELIEQKRLNKSDIAIHMGTLSKAIGVEGGYVAGSRELIDLIKNKAKAYLYTTAPSPLIMRQALINLKDMVEDSSHREKLWDNIDYFKTKISELNLEFTNNGTAIFAIYIEDVAKASKELRDKGIFIPVISPPMSEKPVLRITINASHSKEDIDKLVLALKTLNL